MLRPRTPIQAATTMDIRRAPALAIASLLVASSLGGAFGAHPCPHHDGAAAAGGEAHADAAADGAVGHGSHSAHAQDAGPASEAHGACTCLGECQPGAAPSMPSPGIGTALPAPPALPHAFRSTPSDPRVSIVPFSLPWGNAPPTL